MTKLISVALLLLVAVSFSSEVNGQAALASFINALMPGATQNQGTSILDPLPQKVKDKIPENIKKDMEKITVSQIKQNLPKYKDALKKCLYMTSIKDCISELKKVDPEMNKLLKDIKQAIKEKKPKVMQSLQSLKSMLTSPLLQNIVQTAMNVIQPPAGRRRKRSISVKINVQIVSLKQAPMTLPQIKELIKSAMKKTLEKLNSPTPPSPPSLLQQLINLASSLSKTLKTLFSNPSVMKMLGTQAPPS